MHVLRFRSFHRPVVATRLFGAALSLAPAFAQSAQSIPTPAPLPAGWHEIHDAGAPQLAPVVYADDLAPLGAKDKSGVRPPPALGFAAGFYTPPSGERIDAALAARLGGGFSDGRPSARTYAFALFENRITPERIALLEARGVTVLGYHPTSALSVAIDATTVGALLDEPAVSWIGDARAWQKIHPAVLPHLADGTAAAPLELYVSVFESDLGELSTSDSVGADWQADPGRAPEAVSGASDVRRWHSNGWQQHALELHGAVVDEFVPSIRAFRVRVPAARIAELVALDHVQFVELVQPRLPAHGRSTPFIHSDLTRAFWSGAASGEVVAGTIDSGMYISHEALNHAFSAGWDPLGNPAFVDSCGHGSHVIGTVLADPPAAHEQHRGNAPGLGFSPARRFRQIHELAYSPDLCHGSGVSYDALTGWMAGTFTDGQGNVSPRPHVVNNSYGSGPTPGGWVGTEAECRAIDDAVWIHGQDYVFAAHNHGPDAATLSVEASAKNTLSVANVLPYGMDAGDQPAGKIASSSSRGPCADGRWRPNLSAPGSAILSVATNTSDQYTFKSGTSMAAPHVTGVIAQMLDHYAWLRYEPARTHSLLMATAALTNNAPILDHHHPTLNSYGVGRIDAFRANVTDTELAVSNWGYSQSAGTSAMNDFVVFPGCQRLVVVLHWIEPQASSGASQALVNDLDLYIDAPPLTTQSNQGDYTAGLSSVDNTEIRVIENPAAGTWRWKSHPYSTFSTARVSVTVHQVLSDTTPNATFTLGSSDSYVKPNEVVTMTASVANPSAVLPAVLCDVEVNTGSVQAMTTQLKDGTPVDMLVGEYFDNHDAAPGAIEHGGSRSVAWTLKWASEGVKTFQVRTIAETGFSSTQLKQVTVDGTPPALPTNLQSSHAIGAWSTDASVTWSWTASSDALAGVAGYGVFVSSGAASEPSETQDIGAVTAYGETLATTSASGAYLNLKPVDKSGNWNSGFASYGPILIDVNAPGNAIGLASTSHATNVWSNDPSIDFAWTNPADIGSGVGGYGAAVTAGPQLPPATQTLSAVSSTTASAPGSGSNWYFSLRAHDVAGNWSATYANVGPFKIDVGAPANVVVTPPAQTSIQLVNLTIGATDAWSGVAQMRLKNDGGSFSPWEPFATSKLWTLNAFGGSSATGTRTITLEVRDVAGNVGIDNATTYYYAAPSVFGSACSGSLGFPSIGSSAFAKIGASFSVNVASSAAPAKILLLGFSKASWLGLPLPLDLGAFGSPGCSLAVSADFQLKKDAATNWSGALPNDPTLVGTTLYFQWALVGDPSGKPIVTSQGLQVPVNGA